MTMNEELLNKIIKFKLDTAGKLIKHMPPNMSEEIKDLGRLILKGVNENVHDNKEQPSKTEKSSEKLHHVPIE